MTTPRALFTPATWSEDDSDEEEHFREMVRLRIRHEERFKDVDDVNADAEDAGHPLDPIWGEPPRTAGRARGGETADLADLAVRRAESRESRTCARGSARSQLQRPSHLCSSAV